MSNKLIGFFDIESTGTSTTKDRIIELCISTVEFPSFNILKTAKMRFHPGDVLIEKGAQDAHGIKLEDLVDCPLFKDKAAQIFNFLKKYDYLAGHNIKKFDVPMLYEEFYRNGITWTPPPLIDTYIIMSNMIPRTLAGALKYYTGKDIENAHDAEGDVLSTIDVLKGQIGKHDFKFELFSINDKYEQELSLDYLLLEKSKYENEEKRLDFDGKIILDENNIPIWSFGKNKGLPVTSDLNYCDWVLRGDFSSHTKNILRSLLNK